MRYALTVLVFGSLVAVGCGGGSSKGAASPETAQKSLESDPYALLPSGAITWTHVDAKALYASGSSGKKLAELAERYVPIGEEAGFRPSRDLDQAYVASYALSGPDACAVLTGSFDEAKIKAASDKHLQLKGGGVLMATSYAGRTAYTVNNAGFVVISPKLALAGTDSVLRRALDRLAAGNLEHAVPTWATETLNTAGAAFAFAADLNNQPVDNLRIAGVKLEFLPGLRTARVVGNYKAPGLNVGARATYATPDAANGSAAQLQTYARMAEGLGRMGSIPKLQNTLVRAEGSDVSVSFGLDDAELASKLDFFLGK